VTESPVEHHKAAERHASAADHHDRVARYLDARGDRDRAVLQREIADFERHGAALERRSARIVDPEGPLAARRTSQIMLGRTRASARALSEKLAMAADVLETSADLAEEHANRRQAKGKTEGAAEERRTAERTREAARRARSEAEKWLKVSQSPQ
jgi:hypothetical protein